MDYAAQSNRFIPNLNPQHDTKEKFTITLIFFQENIDLDNATKAILDALQYRIYWDDWQVHELHVYRAMKNHITGVQVTAHLLTPKSNPS